jgi:F-type H+-transporting ATPase subunit gamma
MASLKDLKNRIKSVKNTQKITKAMKMVAAAKLRRAQEAAEAARPYAEKMTDVVTSLAAGVGSSDSAPVLLAGTGADKKHLLVVMTSDRGLCGGFNSSIVRAVRRKMRELQSEGKQGYLFCVGRKGYEQLRFEFNSVILGRISDHTKSKLNYATAQNVSDEVKKIFAEHHIDVVTVVYNHFKSAITQVVTFQQLVPLVVSAEQLAAASGSSYEYEPDAETILEDLLPRNITVQCFRALLENSASEHGARMSAMDSATRNAGEMIGKLSLKYNRTRQAAITTELTEIISGAEAV